MSAFPMGVSLHMEYVRWVDSIDMIKGPTVLENSPLVIPEVATVKSI